MKWTQIFALTRVKPDGRPGLGMGMVLLVFLGCVGCGLYITKILRTKPAQETDVLRKTPQQDKMRTGAKPDPVPYEPLYAVKTQEEPKPMISLDEIYARVSAQTNAPGKNANPATKPGSKEEESNKKDQGWIPVFHPKDIPPATESELKGANVLREAATNRYNFVQELLVITNTTAASSPVPQSGFALKHFLPRGYKVPVILLSQINTSVGSMPVELAVAKSAEWNGNIQLPFGWRLFGTANAGANHKVNVTINMILDPEGREYPVNGMVLNDNKEPGFDGYPLPSPFLHQVLPTFQQSISAFINAAKDTITMPTVVGGYTSNLVAQTETYKLNARNALLDGAAHVMERALERKIAEMSKMYPEGTVVPQGMTGYMLLLSPLDMKTGEIGGSMQFLSKSEREPEPYNISISQQQTYTPLQPAPIMGIPPESTAYRPNNPVVPGVVPGAAVPAIPTTTLKTPPTVKPLE